MRQVTRKGLITVAAASGVLAMSGYAHADSGAQGGASDSPGVLSGNNVQAPIEVPVNVCGNTVNVVGLLNPSVGNSCANESDGKSSSGGGGSTQQGKKKPGSGATAQGGTSDSPGVLSGNNVQAPVSAPVNACGNSVSVIGLLNPTTGNSCANDEVTPTPPPTPEPPAPPKPGKPEEPVTVDHSKPPTPNEPKTQLVTPVKEVRAQEAPAQLAHTGSELPLGVAVPVSAGLLLAGTVLYRRTRVGA